MKTTTNDMTQAAFETILSSNGGRISPAILVDAAKDEASPLHPYFEWDDSVAGEKWRLAQAAQLIRRWKGAIVKAGREAKHITVEVTRRVQSPETDRSKGGASYQATEQIMADPEKREAMIHTALKELAAIRRRFSDLVALADVWRAVDDAIELHMPEPKPNSRPSDRPNA